MILHRANLANCRNRFAIIFHVIRAQIENRRNGISRQTITHDSGSNNLTAHKSHAMQEGDRKEKDEMFANRFAMSSRLLRNARATIHAISNCVCTPFVRAIEGNLCSIGRGIDEYFEADNPETILLSSEIPVIRALVSFAAAAHEICITVLPQTRYFAR